MTERKQGAVCVGEVLIELARGSDGRFSLSCGGDTFNTAVLVRVSCCVSVTLGHSSVDPAMEMKDTLDHA